MIKKVSNWVFGSFFRTMGRFFFFLFFGFLLAAILSKSDIKLTDLFGIATVKADTYVKGVDTPWKNNSGTLLPKNGPYHYDTKTSGSSGGANQSYQVSEFYLQSSEQVDITSIKGGTVEIPFYISATVITSNANEQWVCQTWTDIGNGYSCSNFSPMFTGTIIASPKINMWAMVVYNNGYTDMCTLDTYNNKIRCPIAQLPNNNKIWFIQIRTQVYYGDNYPSQYYFVGLGDKVNLFKNDFVSLEDNQNQNTNQTISTITDSNITEADTEANSFFSNFTSQDNGGISSIITAPLQAISGLVSSTCTPISLPLPFLDNKTIVLPCMSAIYTEHFGAFFTIYQTIIFGAIAYRMLVSLFMMIQGFKNPDDDKIEVVDL